MDAHELRLVADAQPLLTFLADPLNCVLQTLDGGVAL